MADIDSDRERAVQRLEELDDDDEFLLVTREQIEDGAGEYAVNTHSGTTAPHISVLNLTTAGLGYLQQIHDGYDFETAVDDIETTARLHAEGKELGE